MATRGKRTTSRTGIKRRSAAERKRVKARARTERPGRTKATRAEVKRVVPRTKSA